MGTYKNPSPKTTYNPSFCRFGNLIDRNTTMGLNTSAKSVRMLTTAFENHMGFCGRQDAGTVRSQKPRTGTQPKTPERISQRPLAATKASRT